MRRRRAGKGMGRRRAGQGDVRKEGGVEGYEEVGRAIEGW
jgi:hypothetical protein